MKTYQEARAAAQRRQERGEPIYRKAEARDVRTGDVITNDYAAAQGITLTVDYPTWEKFTNPEGWTGDIIRFTGTDNRGQYRERAMGAKPGDRVYVVREAPRDGDTFGALSEWIDPDYEVPEDAWLDDADSLELL